MSDLPDTLQAQFYDINQAIQMGRDVKVVLWDKTRSISKARFNKRFNAPCVEWPDSTGRPGLIVQVVSERFIKELAEQVRRGEFGMREGGPLLEPPPYVHDPFAGIDEEDDEQDEEIEQ